LSRPRERVEARNCLTRIRSRSCGRTHSGRPATASPIGGFLEQWSATETGRSSRRHDWEFSREGSVVEWRAWNWTEIQAPTTSPGVRGALAVEHIYELGESPPTREARTPVAVTFGLPTVNRIRGSLLPGAVCSPIPECDDQHFPFVQVFKILCPLRATHQGACRRSAIDGPQFCLVKSLTPMGLAAATGLARSLPIAI
jgi:hypothetical protein